MYFPLNKLSKEAQAVISEHGAGKAIRVSPHGALMAAWMKGLNIDPAIIGELAVLAHSLRAEDGSIGEFAVPDDFALASQHAEAAAEVAAIEAATAKEVAAVELSISPEFIYAARRPQGESVPLPIALPNGGLDLAAIYTNRAAGF